MPPKAMQSRVFSTMSSSPRRSKSSSTEAGGNFGARPKPPHSGSKEPRTPRTASPRIDSVRGSVEGRVSEERRRAAVSSAAVCDTSPRRSR